MDKDEMEDLMGALLELRSQYRKLQWYGEVNRRGFVKITKKLDKKIATSSSQNRYLATKVDPKAFATNFRLGNDMRAINDWLSGLGEVKVFDDDSSVHSAGSLHRVSSKGTLKLPSSTLDSVDTAIRQDEASTLHYVLAESTSDLSPDAKQRLCLNILQRAISCKSYRTIDFLLTQVESLDDGDDMNKRNIVHRLLIAIGRVRALEALGDTIPGTSAPDSAAMITAAELPTRLPVAFKVEERDAAKTLGKEDPSIKLLTHLLGQLTPAQQPALAAIDIYGRRPLHYAAQYGLVAASEEVMRCMRQWGQFDVSNGIDSQYWQDQEGYAPLHLSVIGGHYRTTKALLHAENWHGDADKSHVRKHVEKSGAALTLATKSNFYKIVQLLVEAGVDVNYQDNHGDTALHVAARFGFKDCAKALIAGYEGRKPNLELAESTYGWTPLFTACVDGHLPIVELLVAAGAEVDKVDLSGWRPIEHAALRGHIGISALLAKITPKLGLSSPTLAPTAAVSMSNTPSLDDRRSAREANTYLPKPVKTFGHRYLTKQSMVLVSLGSMDARKDMPAVKLDNIPLSDAHATQLDTALSIVVSTTGALGEPTVIDLPVQENISTSPITFYTSDPTKVRVMFDIVPTYAGSKDKIVGRGVALLSSIKPSIGSKRITLQGDLAVPVVAADTLDVIGCVNFNFLIITPFAHPNMSITEEQTYWKRTSTMVIGHRGLGKNMTAMKSLQLGENTIQSFIAAANLGASYVEFDVQLTKDHVPVIYHDFLVSETGMDAPVHTLTLEQFLHASGTQTPRSSRPPSPTLGKSTNGMSNGRKYRSYSLGAPDGDEKQNMDDRMKHTRDFKAKGFKANSRGNFIQAPFTTLQEMFEKVPQEVGFNIEMSEYRILTTETLADLSRQNIQCFTNPRITTWTHMPSSSTRLSIPCSQKCTTWAKGAISSSLHSTPTSASCCHSNSLPSQSCSSPMRVLSQWETFAPAQSKKPSVSPAVGAFSALSAPQSRSSSVRA